MGIELEFYAKRSVTVDNTGKKDIQKFDIHTWHLSYKQVLAIQTASDPVAEYISQLSVVTDVYEEAVYADDDWLEEDSPIAYVKRNFCAEHLVEFKSAIERLTKEGYTIHFYLS
jgi:hypothetical protein